MKSLPIADCQLPIDQGVEAFGEKLAIGN